MDCRSARDWLLQAEDPCRLDDGPEGLAGHVVNCSVCRRQAHVLGRLEATGVVPAFHKRVAVRGIDLPVSVFALPDNRR